MAGLLLAAAQLGLVLHPARVAPRPQLDVRLASPRMAEAAENRNVAQTLDTSREKVMTFSYDMSLEPEYEKPTYPGTGNGLSGDDGEYDVVVIGSGMGGLACGAMCAKYGHSAIVLESHIKPGGSAHTFSRIHEGGKYSFEVGPSIFEGLDKPSYNPLRIVMDILGEEMPVEKYYGLGYWTPQASALTRAHHQHHRAPSRAGQHFARARLSKARRLDAGALAHHARPVSRRATGDSRSALTTRAAAGSRRRCASMRRTRSSR